MLGGWLVDQLPTRRIVTALNTAGIHFERGDEVEVLEIDLFTTPDDVAAPFGTPTAY